MGELIWTRRYAFQSVHSLTSGERKERLHGHQYYLEVSFSDADIDKVDQVLNSELLPHLQGKQLRFLNEATGEALVNWIHQRLMETSIGRRLRAVALQETAKNRFISRHTDLRYV